MQIILYSVLLIAIIALLIGIFLGISSTIFKVEVDDRIIKVRECLPGNNCGGCGFAGCDALAEAIVKNGASINACTVGGEPVATKIGAVMGIEAGAVIKMVAFVHCDGNCENVDKLYEYTGEKDCRLAKLMPNNGDKKCAYACMGYGSCVKVCKFGAISIESNVAKVDKDKCTACKACINACPMKIIDLVPYSKSHIVKCSNKDKGKMAMDACKVSCIACGMCEKNCTKNAINVKDNIAVIDYEKCDNCGTCATKCPRKCIL